MGKRMVVCCDGTWNAPDELDDGECSPTNIAKLALSVAPVGPDGVEQRVFYDKGVGTGRRDRLIGGVFGVGLSTNVRDAYRWIVETYEPGDELFLLGFSRGAFTARSTVGLLRNCGVLRREHADRVGDAYALYRDPTKSAHPKALEAELFRRSFSHEARVRFLGVFETVGALGVPLGIPLGGLRLATLVNRRFRFHDTELSSIVDGAFHALAVDERRGPFRPALWTTPGDPGQRVEQVWFSGSHCDVGGGYRDGALAGIPLLWMAERAREFGLAFTEHTLRDHRPDDPPEALHRGECVDARATGEAHDSRTGVYRHLAAYVREFGAGSHERIASSVARRHDLLGDEHLGETFRSALARADDVVTVASGADEPATSGR